MDDKYNENNRASAVLAKIGNGTADADFARAMGILLDRVAETNKPAKLVLTIEVKPRDDLGCLEMRAQVEAKLPKLPAPASQMHVASDGSLLSQQEFMFSGPSESRPRPLPPTGSGSSTTSGRHAVPSLAGGPIAAAPALAPVVPLSAPAPVISK